MPTTQIASVENDPRADDAALRAARRDAFLPTGYQKTAPWTLLRLRVLTLNSVEVTVMNWTSITGWLTVVAVIGIVLGSIDRANRTDPVGQEPVSASTDYAVNPAVQHHDSPLGFASIHADGFRLTIW
jgi:hypothetical protein